jgi:nucleotide-binding universal stress UspA family protein
MAMRVLLATDGSEEARAATTWLASCPLPPDASLRVVTAVTVPPSALDVPPVRDFQQSLRDEAGSVAETTRALLATRFPRAEIRVPEGDPRDEILRLADEWPADLIVVGARVLGRLAGFVMGSVSLGVARHALCPVLVVKGRAALLQTILIALDGSEQAAAAAAFVARLPLTSAVKVRLLGVVEAPRYPPSAPPALTAHLRAGLERLIEERRGALQPALAGVAAAFAARGIAAESRVVVGHPADEIVRAAESADLVVVGARGLGVFKRLLLGSVSEAVLRHVDRPVLVVRGG